jgi:hypothetical protein
MQPQIDMALVERLVHAQHPALSAPWQPHGVPIAELLADS